MNWEQIPLGEVTVKIGSGITPRGGSSVYTDYGTALIRSQNVLDLSFSESGLAYISDEHANKMKRHVVLRNDILLNITGDSTARVTYWNGRYPAVVNQHVAVIRPNEARINSRWLQYYLVEKSTKDYLLTLAASGGSRPALTKGMLNDLLIPLPRLAEQKAIADVLGALDDKIAANIRVKETCTELIKTIGSIPNSNVPVSELAVQIKKQISAGKLQELDVRHYSIPAFDLGYASIESGAEIKSGKNLIEAPCVLVSKLNPRTPRIWSIPTVDSEETTVCSTEFIAWQGTTVPQAALYAALLQGSFSEQLQERASGTSNSHQRVRPQDMQEATIPDVRKLDQETLKLLEALNLQAADLIKENQVLAATRDELLPLLMNRKITVVEAEEAVGDVGVVKQKQQEEGDSDV